MMKMEPGTEKKLGVLLIFVALALHAADAWTGSKIEVSLFTADVSIASPDEITVSLSFTLDTAGRPLGEFKLSGEPPFYQWSKASLQCFTEGDKRYGLERMPRADGLTTLKIVSRRPLRTKDITCQMSGKIDPSQVEAVLTRKDTGQYFLSLPLPAPTSRVGELRATVHFPSAITDQEVVPGELTSEEFSKQYFPSALTLTSTSIPPYQTRTLEVVFSQGILDGNGQTGSAPALQEQIDRYVGMKNADDAGPNFSLIVLLSSLLMFVLISLRNRESAAPGPGLLFPGLGGLPRALLSFCLIMLYGVFTLSGVFTEAMIFLTFAILVQLRTGNPPRERQSWLFDVRRASGLAGMLLFLAGGAAMTLLAWKYSQPSSQNLGAAFVLCCLYLFFPQPRVSQPAPEEDENETSGVGARCEVGFETTDLSHLTSHHDSLDT